MIVFANLRKFNFSKYHEYFHNDLHANFIFSWVIYKIDVQNKILLAHAWTMDSSLDCPTPKLTSKTKLGVINVVILLAQWIQQTLILQSWLSHPQIDVQNKILGVAFVYYCSDWDFSQSHKFINDLPLDWILLIQPKWVSLRQAKWASAW